MNFGDTAIGWLLGIFSERISDDRSELAEYRHTILELEYALQDFLRIDSILSVSDVWKKAKVVEDLLKKCEIHEANLFIQCPEMRKMIDQSLNKIMSYRYSQGDSDLRTMRLKGDLQDIWCAKVPDYNSVSLKKLKKTFFNKGLFGRFWYRITLGTKQCTVCKRYCFEGWPQVY